MVGIDNANCFLIIGCQRSGTTLLRLALECHPQVRCYDEPRSYDLIAGKCAITHTTQQAVGLKIPCLTEQFLGATLWDRFLLKEMPNPYRHERIVFAVRDVRDTVASMMQLSLGGHPWTQAYMLPLIHTKMKRDVEFLAAYGSAFDRAAVSGAPVIAQAAVYWRYKTDALTRYVDQGLPVLAVGYEDLVAYPARELRRVCTFLRLDWMPALLEHHLMPHEDVGPDGTAIGSTDPTRPIDRRSVGRGGANFTSAELDVLEAFSALLG